MDEFDVMGLGSAPRVAIAGAGVIGLCLALALARRGAKVLVIEAGQIGSGASAAAAGMLAPFYEADPRIDSHPDLSVLAQESLARWPAFARSLGADVGLRQDGIIYVARTAKEADQIDRAAEATSMPVRRLEPDAARALEPALTGPIVQAALAENEGQVDVRLLLPALAQACRSAGVKFEEGGEALAIHRMAGRTRGLMMADGRVAGADAVVIAAGAWASRRFGDLPALRHLQPVKGQICAVAPAGRTLSRPIEGPGVYLTPRTDHILIGATREPGEWRLDVDPAVIARLCEAASQIAPEIAAAPVVAQWAGLRPELPDRAPVLGETHLAGVFVACGHGRNGILLAPITADVLADQILGGPVDALAARFSPARFHKPPGAEHVRSVEFK